jgi:cyclopropane-fatty-acyl-phospholipid synthase
MLAIDILERFLSTMDRRSFAVELWDGRRYDPAPNSHAEFVLRVNTPHALTRLFWRPTMLSLGEAFVTKELEIEGDLLAAIALGDRVLGFRPPSREIARLGLSWLLAPRERPLPDIVRDSIGRILNNAARRQPSAFTTISRSTSGSSGLIVPWCTVVRISAVAAPPASTRHSATSSIKICCKLDLRRGDRSSTSDADGAGSFFMPLNAAAYTLSVTLSAAQATCKHHDQGTRPARSSSVHCVDLADYPRSRSTRIASVGVVEHIPRSSLAAYFRHVATMLSPDGHFFNQGITYAPSIGLRGGESFFNTYVFPGGSLVPLGEMVVAAETAGFSVEDTECLRAHYARTLTCWRERLISNRDAIIAATDESTYRVFNLYLAGAALDFMRGRNSVYQMVLRPPASSGSVPPPREGWYERMQPRITRQSPVNRPL